MFLLVGCCLLPIYPEYFVSKCQVATPSFCKISLVKDQGCKHKTKTRSVRVFFTFQVPPNLMSGIEKLKPQKKMVKGKFRAAKLLSTWYEVAHSLHPPWRFDSTRRPSQLLKLQLYPRRSVDDIWIFQATFVQDGYTCDNHCYIHMCLLIISLKVAFFFKKNDITIQYKSPQF